MKTKSILLLLAAIIVSVSLSAQNLVPEEHQPFNPEKFKAYLEQTGFYLLDQVAEIVPVKDLSSITDTELKKIFIILSQKGDFTAEKFKYVGVSHPVDNPYSEKPSEKPSKDDNSGPGTELVRR